jgi:hypothetical protein
MLPKRAKVQNCPQGGIVRGLSLPREKRYFRVDRPHALG